MRYEKWEMLTYHRFQIQQPCRCAAWDKTWLLLVFSTPDSFPVFNKENEHDIVLWCCKSSNQIRNFSNQEPTTNTDFIMYIQSEWLLSLTRTEPLLEEESKTPLIITWGEMTEDVTQEQFLTESRKEYGSALISRHCWICQHISIFLT